MTRKATARTALYIASEYRAAEVREKKHEHNFDARHASGYFERVWSVHPLADLVGAPKHRIQLIRFRPRHLVVEGVTEALRLPRWLLPLNFLLSQVQLLRLLRRIVRRHDVSVIVTTDPFYSGILAVALKWLTGKPLVVRIGGNYDELYRASGALAMPRLLPSFALQNRVARFVLSRANLVAANNRNNLDWGIAHGARGLTAIIPITGNVQRIHVTPPEERESAAGLLRRCGLPGDGPLLLCLGRLIPLKQPDHSLRAMVMVMKEEPAARGVFAGSGPMQPELERLARELRVDHRVHFLGQTNQEDLARLIPRCITVSPVTGLALVECGLGGSPVAAYDRDWQAEFIEDGVSGFIVPAGDWEALGRRTLQIVRDPELAQRFSRAIRARALSYMDPKEIAKMEAEAFDRALDGR